MRLIALVTLILIGSFAQSFGQLPVNKTAKKFMRVKIRMDSVYKAIQKEYEEEPTILKRLDSSQVAWQNYCAAQLEFRYPNHSLGERKSELNYCFPDYYSRLIEDRTSYLMEWLTGSDITNGCKGSIHEVKH